MDIQDSSGPTKYLKMVVTDRSRMGAYRNCPRYRYLHYHHGGLGFERKSLALPLVTGIFVHEALSQILMGASVTASIHSAWDAYLVDVKERGVSGTTLSPVFLAEQKALLQGLVYSWYKVRYPQILREYEPILIEREMLWEMGERNGYAIRDMIRADALVRRRSDGMLFYLEFKTTTKGDENWIRTWEHNAQLLINTVAIEDLMGERLGGVLIEGLLKGSRRKCTLRTSRFFGEVIQDSPLCYAFRTVDNLGGQHFETSWSRGSEHIRVSDFSSDPIKWVDSLPLEDVAAQFVPIPPIRPRGDLLERHRRQMVHQEGEIAWALDLLKEASGSPETQRYLLDCYFPQNDDHCNRYYGSPCDMEEICFNPTVAADPLGSGLYQRRQPHHSPEGLGVIAEQNGGAPPRSGEHPGSGD